MGEVIYLSTKKTAWKVDLVYKDGGKTIHTPGSNFWTTEDGFNVEVEFQAEKWAVLGKHMRAKLVRVAGYDGGVPNPYNAKQRSHEWRMNELERREWDSVRLDVMRRLVLDKARRSPEFREWLSETDSAALVETNWWHDNFWGNCTCGAPRCQGNGSNWLGHILSDLRRIVTPSGIRDASAGSR